MEQESLLTPLGRLFGFFRPLLFQYRRALGLYLLLSILGALASIGSALASRALIDAVLQHASPLLPAAAAGALVLSGLILSSVSSLLASRVQSSAFSHLSESAASALLSADYQDLAARRSGDLLSRLNADAETLASGVIGLFPTLLVRGAELAAIFILLLLLDPVIALIALIASPLSLLLTRPLSRRLQKLDLRLRERRAEILDLQSEGLRRLYPLRIFSLEGRFLSRLKELFAAYRDDRRTHSRDAALLRAISRITGALGALLCLLRGVWRLWQGDLSTGTFVLFLLLAGELSEAAGALLSLLPAMASAQVARERFCVLTSLPQERRDAEAEAAARSARSLWLSGAGVTLKLDHIACSYRERPEAVLTDASFTLTAGESLAVPGPSGEGKTTLIKLLLGLIPADGGSAVLRVGGETLPISEATRCLISCVPQGGSLFALTVAGNLRIAAPAATDAMLWDALEKACAADFVRALPRGLDTLLSEGGAGLSEGQAQRIAIARALLKDAPLLLLDEATSALEPALEERVLRNILADRRRIVILTTHRPLSASLCSRRLRIVDGRLLPAD